MSGFNGSGTFQISGVGLPYSNGTIISSSVANQLNTDLATGLSNCITKDGQQVITANIGWNNYNINNLSALGIGTSALTGLLEIASGASSFVYVSSSGSVGIGTSSPSKKLTVTGGDILINTLTIGLGTGSIATNTAVGVTALNANTTGSVNTAVGYYALISNTTGTGNTAIGSSAMTGINTGNNNTAIGYNAGIGISSGSSNISIGSGSASVLTTGQRNICIGNASSTSSNNAQDQIIIGYNGIGQGDGYVSIGSSSNYIYANYTVSAAWTKSSDQRIKRNINDDTLGLSFITKLRPVTYQWKPNNEIPKDLIGYNETNTQNVDVVMHGLIAQEVKAALDSEGVDTFAGWDIREADGLQGVSNEMFVLPLINAIKELKTELDSVKAELERLKG